MARTTTTPTMAARAAAACASTAATMLLLATTAGPAAAQDTATLARNLAATCANCHGTQGQARADAVVLAGMPAETTIAKLAAFKSGALPATVMHQLVKGYTDEQLRLIAGYFAAQPRR